MTTLNWKPNRDKWATHLHEARADDGGRYRISQYSKGFTVRYCPPKRRGGFLVGSTETEIEAGKLAQADNDARQERVAS
jgi:hypothetical protein